jgi:hypothetical protein
VRFGSREEGSRAREHERTVASNEWTSKTSQTVQPTMDADDEDGKWKTGQEGGRKWQTTLKVGR